MVRDGRRRGEVALMEFNCSLEEGVLDRVAPAVITFLQRREFPEKQTVWCFLWRYSKYGEHLRKPVFCSGGILFTQSTTRIFKIKNKRQAGSYEIQIYPITPSIAFPNLVRLSLLRWFLKMVQCLIQPQFSSWI
jgi:hypothetical protein